MIIDNLASQYGWSKQQILREVYIDEVPEFYRLGKKRRAEQRLHDLEMSSAVLGAKEYKVEIFNRYRAEILESLQVTERVEKLDRAGLQRLRVLLGGRRG